MTKEQHGAAEAEGLLDALGFESLPIVPDEVVRRISDDTFRVELSYIPFNSEKILGNAQGNKSAAVIAVNSRINDSGRRNFTAAHEIGHVCLHIEPGRRDLFECEKDMFADSNKDPFEREANGFASGLLMPKNLISDVSSLEVNWHEIHELKNLCDASREVVIRRLFSLNKGAYAFVVHKNNHFQRVVKSNEFDFYVNRNSMSKEDIDNASDGNGSKFSSGFDLTDAADWVNPKSKYGEIREIYASSIKFDNGFVYTLLHYDDECFVDEDELSC